jgi:hypothetical protein
MQKTRLLIVPFAYLLAACTHVSVVGTSSGATTTTVTSASVAVSGGSSAAAWALLGIGLIAAEAVNPVRPLEALPGELDPRRRVNEVDCTKPIADWSANLRCK